MLKKTITTLTLALMVGVGLSACSAPVEEATPTPSTPKVEVEETAQSPVEDFIEFAENPEPTYDGVVVECPASDDGASATAARVMPTDEADPSAVKGETSYFVVECSYPASDEIMAVIEEMNSSQG